MKISRDDKAKHTILSVDGGSGYTARSLKCIHWAAKAVFDGKLDVPSLLDHDFDVAEPSINVALCSSDRLADGGN